MSSYHYYDRKPSSTTKPKKGSLAVNVTEDYADGSPSGTRRFVIPISYLHHPTFRGLLERTREVYGYPTAADAGPLRLACSVDEFLHLRWIIEKEGAGAGGGRRGGSGRSNIGGGRSSGYHFQHALSSFHSC